MKENVRSVSKKQENTKLNMVNSRALKNNKVGDNLRNW